MTLHDYQIDAIEKGREALLSNRDLMIVSPTGSGKSYVLAGLLESVPEAVLTVPTIEIGLGIYDKLGGANPRVVRSLPEAKQRGALTIHNIFTVKQYLNLLLSGSLPPAKYLLHDEGHHSVDDTHDAVHAYCGQCPRVCVTATAYRGTPDETVKLRQAWGEPYVALKLKAAVERKIIAKPVFSVWPLVNDDMIAVRDGEFVLSQVEGALKDQLPRLVERIRSELLDDSSKPLRPTMLRCPGVKSAEFVGQALTAAGIPAVVITGDTSQADRQRDLARVTNCEAVLVQVRVVGEGVDLPMRVLVDLAPTISPVLWMQAVGRITRPTEQAPRYVATNHNLTRHAYLWEGLIPPAQIRDAQKAWGPEYKPSRRNLARALGLEGFGKFTVSPVPLVDGSEASLYALQTKDGMHLYGVLIHPCVAEPMFFEKINAATGEIGVFRKGEHEIEYAKKKYGPWRKIRDIPSADGYVSVKPGPITQPMLDYWLSAAKGRGLDPAHLPDARQFQALPMLMDTRSKFLLEERP